MKTIDRYLLRQFLPLLLVGLFLFIMLLQLIDLFANLWKYLSYDASAYDILRIALLYLPKCISYSLPISLLFATAYTFGDLYARNELIIIFASGIPLKRLALSLFVLGGILSIASFQFEDRVVIRTTKSKKELSRTLLRQQISANESDVVVKAAEGKIVYAVDYYNDLEKTINGVLILERTSNGDFKRYIQARKARWVDGSWSLENAVEYRFLNGQLISEKYTKANEFFEQPETFRRNALEIEELRSVDAAAFIGDLQSAGLPIAGALADYHKRFAFAATPFVVILLSVAMGGRFRKNILLMSLLASLVSSVVYYVCQMITMMMAKLGLLPPILGAWAPAALFVILGTALIVSAKT